nr:DEAD/DEAH box helicase [Candidatus Sigynarchaeota archaeon]
MSLEPFLKSLISKAPKVKRSVVHERVIPARPAIYQDVPKGLFQPRLQEHIDAIGFSFYSHQATAIEKILGGKNVIIATSAASGKSTCFLFPAVDALLRSGGIATTLLVFPLKALAQDQYTKIKALLASVGLPEALVGVYDADATIDEKRHIRADCKIIVTNPYGLHQYLGNLRLWKDFFEHLTYIVFDEVHVYNGVFGSNIAFVMRRLQRIALAFKRIPQWIFCSATIGNPVELATSLTGLPFELVDNDGSGSAPKRIWFWDPMYIDALDQRLSYHQDTRELFKTFAGKSFQTLVFTQSRKMAELQAKWARDEFAGTPLASRVMSYRAGYPARERRMLEKKLRSKELVGIAATSALELGIDIGSLDIVIISGFPGSITSFWQQAGRCGRSANDSLVVFCASADALDQYYMQNPDYFFAKRHEDAVIDLGNPYIVKGQIACAVKEISLHEEDASYFGPRATEILAQLVEEKVIHKIGERYFYSRNDFPAEKTSLNSIPAENYKVFEQVGGKKRYLTSETESRVFSTLHDGAIFLYMAETYRVEKLDLHEREVVLKREDVDYYTEALYTTTIQPITVGGDSFSAIKAPGDIKPATVFSRRGGLEPLEVCYGDVRVEHEYTKYVVKKIATDEAKEFHPLTLPKTVFNTKSVWFNIPLDVQTALDVMDNKKALGGGIHAVEHGAISLFPKNVLCSRWDVGGVSIDMDPLYRKPMIYIYDAFPGGIGLAEKAKNNVISLLTDTLSLIEKCTCKADTGCPSCVQSPKCGNGNQPMSKKAAIKALSMILENIMA